MAGWRWTRSDVVYAIHDRQIAEHGGLDGVRDKGMIDSALARPINLLAYGQPDAADLAAAYACGSARNHGFADGNKRIAWTTARLFLVDNGFRLQLDKSDAVRTMEAVAAGTLNETDVAAWFRQRFA